MLGLAIAGLLVDLALPFYGDWIADYQVLNHAQLLAGTHEPRARRGDQARPSRQPLQVARTGVQCAPAGGWDAGCLVYVDADRDGAVDAGDAALRVEGPAAPGITIRGNRPVDDYVSYTASARRGC